MLLVPTQHRIWPRVLLYLVGLCMQHRLPHAPSHVKFIANAAGTARQRAKGEYQKVVSRAHQKAERLSSSLAYTAPYSLLVVLRFAFYLVLAGQAWDCVQHAHAWRPWDETHDVLSEKMESVLAWLAQVLRVDTEQVLAAQTHVPRQPHPPFIPHTLSLYTSLFLCLSLSTGLPFHRHRMCASLTTVNVQTTWSVLFPRSCGPASPKASCKDFLDRVL